MNALRNVLALLVVAAFQPVDAQRRTEGPPADSELYSDATRRGAVTAGTRFPRFDPNNVVADGTAREPLARHTYYLIDASFEGIDDEAAPDAVRAEIDRQMRLRGYEYLEPGDFNDLQPDIVVFYTFFDQAVTFRGLTHASPGAGESPGRLRYRFAGGTLVIQMKEHRSQRIFWLGFAERLNEGDSSPETFSATTRGVMDKFTLLPSGYDRRYPAPAPTRPAVAKAKPNRRLPD
jgi:hypothetical protein